METINVLSGLLTQKPEGAAPEIGQIKCYTVEKRTSAKGKDWLKVKNSTPDKGGSNYRILNVQQTDFVDAHGNISFSIELEAAPNGEYPTPTPLVMGGHGPASMTKDDYWARKEQRELENKPRIERQHSQHMAVLYATLKGLTDIEPDKFRLLIDWFDRDIGHKAGEEVF